MSPPYKIIFPAPNDHQHIPLQAFTINLGAQSLVHFQHRITVTGFSGGNMIRSGSLSSGFLVAGIVCIFVSASTSLFCISNITWITEVVAVHQGCMPCMFRLEIPPPPPPFYSFSATFSSHSPLLLRFLSPSCLASKHSSIPISSSHSRSLTPFCMQVVSKDIRIRTPLQRECVIEGYRFRDTTQMRIAPNSCYSHHPTTTPCRQIHPLSCW